MISTLMRTSIIAAVTIVAMTNVCDDSTHVVDDYVSIITTRDSQVIDVLSIDLDDSRVARAIFSMSVDLDDYDAVSVVEINSLTRVIDESALTRVCIELEATDIECFA